MIKFNSRSPERFADACTVLERMLVLNGNETVFMRIIPRFALNKDGEYFITVHHDVDGDIESFEFEDEAFRQVMSVLTPKRMEKIKTELMEAAKAIVNPPKEGG